MSVINVKPSGVFSLLTVMALCGFVAAAQAEEFEEADVYFELNHTDGDLGIHALIDGEPWKRLRMNNEAGEKVLDLRVKRALRQQGMTELFFESEEPDFEELPPADFFARFPAGEYNIKGWLLEGGTLESTDELTHAMPAPPGNVTLNGVPAAGDCDADPLPLLVPPITIDWDPVTMSHPDLGVVPPVPIEVTRYQLVIEEDETELGLSADLLPDVTAFTVPADYMADAEELKFEIVVREDSGNQTALESCFEIDRGD